VGIAGGGGEPPQFTSLVSHFWVKICFKISIPVQKFQTLRHLTPSFFRLIPHWLSIVSTFFSANLLTAAKRPDFSTNHLAAGTNKTNILQPKRTKENQTAIQENNYWHNAQTKVNETIKPGLVCAKTIFSHFRRHWLYRLTFWPQNCSTGLFLRELTSSWNLNLLRLSDF